MHTHKQIKYRKRPRGNLHKVQMSLGEKQWHGPIVSHCWAMIDIHSVRLLFYPKKTEQAFTPLKVKAVLTSLTVDVEAQVALWEHLKAAWGGSCWFGVFLDCSHVKAACGSGVEDSGGGSLVCFLSRQEQILPPHRAGKALCAGGEACSLAGCVPGCAKEHRGLACCPTDT